MCNINNKIKVFFIVSAKLRIISKAMQSFRAYPALNSLGVSHSQVAWQIVRPYRHCTDEETNIVPLWSSYLFAFCPFYIIIVYTHAHTQGAYLDQSVLVTSPYACHHVLAQEHRVLQEEVSSSGFRLILFPSLRPLMVNHAEKDGQADNKSEWKDSPLVVGSVSPHSLGWACGLDL